MSTPLPKVDSPLVQRIADEDPNFPAAYNVCLSYEIELPASKTRQRHITTLGPLLLYAPNQDVCTEVTQCINSSETDNNLSEIGAFFERYVILAFAKSKGRTPKPGEHPLSPSFETTKDEVKAGITQATKDCKGTKERVLIRDNRECLTTGTLDHTADRGSMTDVKIHTQCAHIIPQGMFFGVDPKSKDNSKLDHSASILAVLKRFQYDIDKFNGKHVHSLINVLTLDSNVHDAFDRLELYFEATPQKGTYDIKWFGSPPHRDLRRNVTFVSPDPDNLPVPAPDLLALHATCCKVAYFTGVMTK